MTKSKLLVGFSGVTVPTALSKTGVGTNIGVSTAVCSSLIASVATKITNKYFSELKLRFTKLKVWTAMINILCEKIL